MFLSRAREIAAAIPLLVALAACPAGALAEEPGWQAAWEIGAPVPEIGTVAASPGAADDSAATPPGAADNTAADNTAAAPPGAAAPPADNTAEAPEAPAAADEAGEPPPATVADPLEPVNRALFAFNDKAYFWVLKPVAQGYRAVVPQDVRVAVRNFFSNLGTPARFANNLLQGKLKGAGTELLRFLLNSTVGMAGLFDPAETGYHIRKRDEDLGQTLGRYGLGQGFYIVWPILGPSTGRDTVGLAGDSFLDPVNYLRDQWAAVGVKAFKSENEVSLSIGDYEDLKKSSLDPYAAVRDAYVQNRAKKVRE